ncbi:Uncharacterised protein [Mycobacteroides abscessus subsp. abscessus]|nr:Uncharacterised protein [Mycobacteroides abscessus subsp. abscessus]
MTESSGRSAASCGSLDTTCSMRRFTCSSRSVVGTAAVEIVSVMPDTSEESVLVTSTGGATAHTVKVHT